MVTWVMVKCHKTSKYLFNRSKVKTASFSIAFGEQMYLKYMYFKNMSFAIFLKCMLLEVISAGQPRVIHELCRQLYYQIWTSVSVIRDLLSGFSGAHCVNVLCQFSFGVVVCLSVFVVVGGFVCFNFMFNSAGFFLQPHLLELGDAST